MALLVHHCLLVRNSASGTPVQWSALSPYSKKVRSRPETFLFGGKGLGSWVPLFSHRNKHIKQTAEQQNRTLIEIENVGGALRQLKYNLMWRKKRRCLPSVSSLDCDTKGAVTRWRNWPECSFVKHLSRLRHVWASRLSVSPWFSFHLEPRSPIHLQNFCSNLWYFTKSTLY